MTTQQTYAALAADPDAGLESLLAALEARHRVVFETVRLAGMEIAIPQIADMADYVERLAERADASAPLRLPFWAKLWPAALPLAALLAKMEPRPASLLEIGAGVGLCGLVAAMRGVPTLLTDLEPEAVVFARAAILKNGLAGSASAQTADFTKDRLGRRFAVVAASEALYLPHTHAGLLDFLEAHLEEAPEAQVLLGCDDARRTDAFFAMAAPRFALARMETTRTDPEGVPRKCAIYRLRNKPA